ncbi:hypothetical protein UI24_16780 [Mycobacteroides franklinii]|nr:hypothetical protein [Mycobacteroides franklinii]
MNTIRVRANSRIGQAICNHPRSDYQVAISLTHGAALLTIPGGDAHYVSLTHEVDGDWITLQFRENVL